MVSARRKTKKTKLTVILLLIAIAIGSAIFLGHQLLFKSLDPQEKAEIDDTMDKITQGILDEIEKDISRSQDGAGGPEEGKDNDGDWQDGNEEEVRPSKDKRISEIVASYENGFASLQDEGNAIVNRLVEGIKSDYREVKTSGAGKVELAKLATSYTNRAKAMEAGMDSSVNVLSARMKEDLTNAGMDEKAVKEYISKIKDEYKKQKDERRKLLLSKAKEYL